MEKKNQYQEGGNQRPKRGQENNQNAKKQQPKGNQQAFEEEKVPGGQQTEQWDFFSNPKQTNNKKGGKPIQDNAKKPQNQPLANKNADQGKPEATGASSNRNQKENDQQISQPAKNLNQGAPAKNQQPVGNSRQNQNRPQGGFTKQPLTAKTSNMIVQKVPLVTNQFKLTLHSKYVIFTYAIDVVSDQPDCKARIREIIQKLDKEIKLCFLNYVHSGYNLFSPSSIQEEVQFKQILNGHNYELRIRKVGQFNLDNIEMSQAEKNPIQLTFLNLMIQKFMRSGSLQQIGKLPRFFRPSEKESIIDPQLGQLEIWPGYKASSYVYNSGVFLALESMNKFFRRESCLDKIKDMLYQHTSIEDINEFFQERQVLTEWGSKRFYKISRVRMDTNPVKALFQADGNAVSVRDYFKAKYNVDLDPTQPLLEVGHRKDSILLPSQICYIESIPEALKKKKDLIAKYRKNPQEKMDSVSEVIREIAKNPELEEWGISIDTQPYNFEARILTKPSLITGNSSDKREIVDKSSFNQPILQPVALKAGKWAIVYDVQDYDEANMILDNFTIASERYGLFVGDPVWIECPQKSNASVFEKYINEQVDQNIKAVVVLLPRFQFYPQIKRALDKKGVISQLVQKSNVRKGQKNSNFGLSLASELLKQLNAKAGGDLYHITLPKMKFQNTMLIGMDVCHFGPKSIVGFCATLNETYSKYYSQVYYQAKGKEIGNKEDIEKCYIGAIDAYAQANSANVEHIIIFRDGVGDAMREQVRSDELQVLKNVIKKKFPITQPKITLVIVNKRINQRFFQMTNTIKNPPAGTIVDNCMIYNGKENDSNYDFFLISQQTTQGCILPTHFFVSYDDSGLSKETLQELTYNLCFFYFNWSGSIKVPAPCQYAHKVAKYTLDIQAKPKGCENLYFL